MSIETIVQENCLQSHAGLADMDVAVLKQLRSRQMKNCFRLLEESPYRMESVAKSATQSLSMMLPPAPSAQLGFR